MFTILFISKCSTVGLINATTSKIYVKIVEYDRDLTWINIYVSIIKVFISISIWEFKTFYFYKINRPMYDFPNGLCIRYHLDYMLLIICNRNLTQMHKSYIIHEI